MSNARNNPSTLPDDEVNLQALAGLLHDIGKFAVRAGEKGSLPVLDPLVKSSYGQYHALLSADAIDKHVPEAWVKRIKTLAGNHHRPQANDPAQQIITLADHLSAGERDDLNDDGQRHTQPRQLRSIFAGLYADHVKGKDLYWPLRPLSVEQADGQAPAIFPAAALPQSETWDEYATLWHEFCQQWAQLKQAHQPNGDLASYVESLLWLMQRFTTAMPSAYYGSVPDISLYDHSRMTGALAAVMTGLDAAQVKQLSANNVNLSQDKTAIAYLVGGDLSGIQDFIYTITARGAASALRGRSFYLQLLTEAVMRYVLRALKLPITNVVYAGGGKFYLLARVSDAAAIAQLQQAISRVLLRHHGGDLYLSLQAVSLQAQDFFGGKLSEKWGELGQCQVRAKQQRFSELGAAAHSLFAPIGQGGLSDRQCQVCGNEHSSTQLDENVRKCQACVSYETLGEALRSARYWAIRENTIDKHPNTAVVSTSYEDVLQQFGFAINLSDTLTHALSWLGRPAQHRVLFALDDKAYQEALMPETHKASANWVLGQKFIANVMPRLRSNAEILKLRKQGVELPPMPLGKIKPFDALAIQATGVKRLGVLRMDVDNAGKLFSEGLGKHATLSRIAHLSMALNLFFEGWVAHLARHMNIQGYESTPDNGERIYAVYCGGDDVFLLGAWDEIVTLAIRIQTDLARYTGQHTGIHVSAGLALVSGKYPLYRAAQLSEEAEKKAKQGGKNAITFLDERLTWHEFEIVQRWADDFVTWVNKKVVSNAFLQLLQGLHLQNERARTAAAKLGKKPQYSRATWMAAYQLSRLLDSKEVKNSAYVNDIQKINAALQQPNANILGYALAARWAQLRLRE